MDQKLLMNNEYKTPPFRPSGIARRRISILKEGFPQNWQYPVPDERGPEGHVPPPPPPPSGSDCRKTPKNRVFYDIASIYGNA